jgi:hypothetical protein
VSRRAKAEMVAAAYVLALVALIVYLGMVWR